MRASSYLFVLFFGLTAVGVTGCATGTSPYNFTTASLPSFAKPVLPTSVASDPDRSKTVRAVNAPAGLGVAGPNGPKAPRYQSYQWNGNHQRASTALPRAKPVASSPPVSRRGTSADLLTWRTSPRMAEQQAQILARAASQPAVVEQSMQAAKQPASVAIEPSLKR
jgi:hypothetical protein